jgi:RNA polymerase sigma factor (sigma-70 family)
MDITLTIYNDEQSFIQACIRKERWAQKKLYEDNYSTMMAVAIRYADTNDDALDILHEGFIKIFKNIEKYQIGTSLNAWIKRIVVNTAIDYYRKEKRRRTESIENEQIHATYDADVISQLTSEEILTALQRLSPSYRSIFNLYIIEGYTHKEISMMLNITESTCRSNLVKARLKLKAILLGMDISKY